MPVTSPLLVKIEKQHLRSAADLLDQGLLIVDSSNQILYTNPTAERILASISSITIESSIIKFTGNTETDKVSAFMQNVRRTPSISASTTLTIQSQNQRERPILFEINYIAQESKYFIIYFTELDFRISHRIKKAARLFSLTDREGAVLEHLAGSSTEPQIAEKLEISKNTLRTHRKNIYAKLQVKTRVELAMLITRIS
ncbi:LuxR C-terminal-related transcriptional regulator [Polycladidibacter stylochi]|uniref:helix-turn-helix transcriptional regulator n=1 Tax=Polycladidibacter stylochi TaxID=1807766 RepID=UPI0008370CAA|nr:LuxR C-terminal-related transcriptional regulator [Pseudovibrio stylochi]